MSHGRASAALQETVTGSYEMTIQVDAYRWLGGSNTLLAEDLPVVGGALSMDASNSLARSALEVVIGHNGEFEPTGVNDPLAPWGQYLVLKVKVRLGDGTWETLKMGEFPILTTRQNRPSGELTVTCGDWSSRMEEYRCAKRRPDGIGQNTSIKTAIKSLAEAAIPDKVFQVHADARAESKTVGEVKPQIDDGRWAYAQALADGKGLETLWDTDGNLVIRRPGNTDVGPDHGSKANPVAVIRDGSGGVISGVDVAWTREGSYNGVIVVVTPSSRYKKGESKYPPNAYRTRRRYWRAGFEAPNDDKIIWGDKFGRVSKIVEWTRNNTRDDVMDDAEQRAKELYRRRAGIVRSVEIETAPLWWLEPDDKVKVSYRLNWNDDSSRVTEDHRIVSVLFNLDPQNVTSRLVLREDYQETP